jgi:para-nitrobenzyl esterase
LALIVVTTAGKVRGTTVEDGVLIWRGIPYAAAPVGPLRWLLPQPPQAWSGVRDATAWGAPSLQPAMPGGDMVSPPLSPPVPPPAEDCLFVNVSAPADAQQRPVLVWLHGGGYQIGSGTDIAGAGVAFARSHGVVVVTFNYRLGALGFLSLDGEEHTGAYGLHDQIALLRWVRDNIASFGGDPGQVTIYGLSAGAKSVGNLMGSPLARGLFHHVASSSGGAEYVATPRQADSVASAFLRQLGTSGERLREVPAEDVLHAQQAMTDGIRGVWVWRPTIDGLALNRRPIDAIAAGAAAGIPLLAEHCVDECSLYQVMEPDSADQADRVLGEYFGKTGRDDILSAYAAGRPDTADDARQLRIDVMTDERYAIPTTRLADAQSAHAPVWRSRYDGPLTGLAAQFFPGRAVPAFHGSDTPLVWNGGPGVADQLHNAWGAFITTGSPQAAGLPAWPEYTCQQRLTMIFSGDDSHVEADPDAARRRAWDGRDWQPGTWYHIDGLAEEGEG